MSVICFFDLWNLIMKKVLTLFWLFHVVVISFQRPDIYPTNVSAVDGATVVFSCKVNGTDQLSYIVNNSAADLTMKGFMEEGIVMIGMFEYQRNLTVNVSSMYNNTEIYCVASPGDMKSETANLTVQGRLDSVGSLSFSFINSTSVNISWSPPFTLPGTTITGYNISISTITSNGTTTNYFTLDSFYVLEWSDDFICNDTSVAVSGYNGLDGELQTIPVWQSSVPPPETPIQVSVIIDCDLKLKVNINVTTLLNICDRPSSTDVDLFNSSGFVGKLQDIMLSQDPFTNILTVNTTLTVLEDQRYTAVVSFSNLAGKFSNIIEDNFTTFGVESVVITDTTGGRVCLECSFSSFSTDTGCTVELVSSDSVNYRDTFNRSGNTAEGCVSGVTAGEYVVRVYDQSSSSELVHVVDNVTVSMLQVLSTTTIMSFSSASLRTMASSPILEPPSNDGSRHLTSVIIGASISGSVILCLVIVIAATCIPCIILWMKKKGQIDPEHAIPEDKPSKCAADQKTSDTGVYVDIHVEESDNPLPRVSDDKTVTYSQPRFEKMDRPLNDDLSDPTRHDETKFDEQDFDEKDINIRSHKPCVDSDKEVPPVPTQREN